MLRITHLGHAGWMLQSGDHAVLVDPIFTSDFGRGPAGARMPAIWPPRLFSFDRFPKLNAVVVTHEHEDHFNLPSLNLLDRKIPIYLSSRASVAAPAVLRDMHFEVRPLAPGEPLCFGPLQLLPLSPDHITTFNCDEWDGLGILATDTIDRGAFFTPVDVRPTRDMVQRMERATQGSRHILTHIDDHLKWIPAQTVESILLPAQPPQSDPPRNGYRQALLNGERVEAIPGTSITVSADGIVSVEDSADFVRTPPVDAWPARPIWRYHPEDHYAPACGGRELSEGEWEELAGHLRQLAEFLYGGVLYRRLYSLTLDSNSGNKPTFLFALLDKDTTGHRLFEYEPGACAFRQVCVENPFEAYLCGIECWATDLLAVFRGDFEPRILSLGHSRFWRPDKSIPDPFMQIVWPFFHPQRRPAQCLAAYRAQLRKLPEGMARVFYRDRVEASDLVGAALPS